jgi:excisionase family DNA binding protein
METQYLTVPAVAKRLNVSTSTVWRLIRQGDLPAHKFGARTTRIAVDDLQNFEASTRQPGRHTQRNNDRQGQP